MDKEIIVAIIGGGALVVVALINGIFALINGKKGKSSKQNLIKQEQSGQNNVQIGVQNNYGDDRNG